MFEIITGNDNLIYLKGRLDASQAEKARAYLNAVDRSCTLDLSSLDYISSAGLGVLLAAQKRLSEAGHELKLAGPNKHIKDIFYYSGLNHIFKIE